MFRYDTFREQLLIIVMFFGVALIFYLILFFVDLSMPRKKKPGEENYELNYLSWYKAIPWSIWVTALSLLFFMFIYLLVHLLYPINI